MKKVRTAKAPGAFGPYSQAIDAQGMVFCSGQVGVDPQTKQLADGVEAQAEQALRNLAAVLEAAGLRLTDVVKTTIWLTDAADFSTVNAVYAKYFGDPAPARSAPVVAAIPFKGARISIEAIAVRPA
ncbi:MAG TPA: Rid family detoxifying hydrolase [Candidatus Limnocylindrales bacterium]|nr:Rid family detoxifying hydrolase [Candidatus Limnocylindrales bacterium]